MNKPIYRHLAEKKWRGYPFRQITQRISQLNIVPDVLPKFEPTMDVQLHFRRAKIEPGSIVDSRVSELAPRLRVQSLHWAATVVQHCRLRTTARRLLIATGHRPQRAPARSDRSTEHLRWPMAPAP